MVKYYNAIIITAPQPVTGKTALKYHNIPNKPAHLDKFFRFALKFPGVHHINFYDAETRKFVEQVRFTAQELAAHQGGQNTLPGVCNPG